jgi:hypothetical protein
VLVIVLLLLLWTARGSGEHLLVKWGVLIPSSAQVATATRYLRYRRLLYAAGLVLGPLALVGAGRLFGIHQDLRHGWGLLASVVAALLVAEVVAALRPVRGTSRAALLSRRRWRDLVPVSAVCVHLLILTLAVLQAVAALAARSWAVGADAEARAMGATIAVPDPADSWFVLAGALLGGVAVYGVVLLAARRRADADDEIDPVLRTRTARVAVGVGIGLALGLLNGSNSAIANLHALGFAFAGGDAPRLVQLAHRLDGPGMLIVVVVGLAEWWAVSAPPRRQISVAGVPASSPEERKEPVVGMNG